MKMRIRIMVGAGVLLLVSVGLLLAARLPTLSADASRRPVNGGQTRREPDNDIERLKRLAAGLEKAKRLQVARLPRLDPDNMEREPEYQAAIRDPEDIKTSLLQGEEKWSATVLGLEDLNLAKQARRECGDALGGEIEEVCNYRIDMAIERIGPRRGVIRRVSGVIANGAEEEPEPVCEAYAGCIAYARMGAAVPLPEEERRIYGVSQELQTTPMPSQMRDPEFMARTLDEARLGMEAYRSQIEPDDALAQHRLKSMAQTVNYLEGWVKELRGEE